MTDESGRVIAGRYRLAGLLGQGGMGFVWRAHDQVLDREVAVKEVLDLGEELGQRAFREARAAARLNHPGIVTVHDLVAAEGRYWIVMELVEAPSLEGALRAGGPMAPDRVARLGLALLEALRAAHAAGILHRDIKPSNVLLPGDRAVLTDFGIATIQGDEKLTATGIVVGTPAYLPPERVRGEAASPASDIWALGATLSAAVTGQPPRSASPVGAGQVADAGPLAPVLAGLLRDDPAARLTAEQAGELIARLFPGTGDPGPGTGSLDTAAQAYQPTAAAQARFPVPGPVADRGTSPARRRKMRSRLIAAAVAAAAAVTAIVLGVALSGGQKPGPVGSGPVGATDTATAGPTAATAAGSPTVLAPSPSVPAPAIGPAGYPASNPKIPAGYSVYTDSALHFSAAIPSTWLSVTDSGGRRFCAPPDCPVVIFVQRITGESHPVADIDNTSAANGDFSAPDYSGYHRLRIGPVSYYAQAAEAEFTVHKAGTPGDLHGLARIFTVTSGGTDYYVQLTALAADWRSSLPVFGVFFATFRPLA